MPVKVIILLLLGFFSISTSAADSDLIKRRFTYTDFVLERPSNVPNPFANKGVPSDFKTVQHILAEERRTNKLYEEVWQDATYELQQKKKTLPSSYFNPTTPDECYIAVIAYTLNTQVVVNGTSLQLYRDFNNKYRDLTTEDSWTAFPYRSFYYLLTMSLPGIKNRPDPSHTSWRGMYKFHFDPVPQVGDTFYFDYFASTTTDRPTAERFMRNDGTLVQLDGGAASAMGVAAYSAYGEDEIVVFPKNKFKVKQFERKGKKDLLVIERAA